MLALGLQKLQNFHREKSVNLYWTFMNNEGTCSVSLTSPFQVEFLQRTLHFLVQYTFLLLDDYKLNYPGLGYMTIEEQSSI